MKQTRNCGNCDIGKKMSINKDILCMFKGVVSRDFVCSKHILASEARNPPEKKPKCAECEFFILSQSETEQDKSTGYCQLFTVRYYNGELKNACSKFNRRTERIIS